MHFFHCLSYSNVSATLPKPHAILELWIALSMACMPMKHYDSMKRATLVQSCLIDDPDFLAGSIFYEANVLAGY
jgi:hypothetical protein